LELPKDITDLFSGCNIVSTKHLRRPEHLEVSLNILQTLYDFLNQETGGQIKLVTIFEEAHSLLSHKLTGNEKVLAQGVEKLIEDCTKEKGKYGCKFVFVTQSISDFRQSTKTVRDQVDCRFFLRSTDISEGKYIEHFLGKESMEMVKHFKPGESIILSPLVSGLKFFVRPPFSSIREPSDNEIRAINSRWKSVNPVPSKEPELTELEARAMEVINDYYWTHHEGIPVKILDQRLGLKRGRKRANLLGSLKEKGLIEITKILGRKGNPSLRIIPL
jgi:hypothetical protein